MKKIFWPIAIVALIIVGVVAVACSKDPDGGSAPSPKMLSDIPHFESLEELDNAVAFAIACDTITELLDLESSQGRMSIGAISDVFYDKLSPELFDDEKILLDFYTEHSAFLDTNIHEDGISIMPKWFTNPYRYAANKDGIFSVGNSCHRIFKQGMVSTDINNLGALQELDESGLAQIDTSLFFYAKNTKAVEDGCFPFPRVLASRTCGRDRIVVELGTAYIRSNNQTYATTGVRAYCERRTIWWWSVSRKLVLRGDVIIHWQPSRASWNNSWQHDNLPFNRRETRKCLSIILNSKWPLYGSPGNKYYHYWAFDITAFSPDISIACQYGFL